MEMNKKGSAAVLIMLFFVTLLTLISAFIAASKKEAVESSVRSLGQVWTASVLGEYDRHLLERYGIFGFYGQPQDVSAKIDYYAGKSFADKRYINYQGSRCSLYDYSLANAEVIRKQFITAGKAAAAEDAVDAVKTNPDGESGEDQESGVGGGNDTDRPENEIKRNEVILTELPSEGTTETVSLSALKESIKNLGSFEELYETGTRTAFEVSYIHHYFGHAGQNGTAQNRYLKNEMEYLICGKQSDSANKKGIKRRIVAAREIMNLAYIEKEPRMQAETLAAAEVLTPGPQAVLTQKLLDAGWALAESENDYRQLYNGRKVPLVKDSGSWAVSLEAIVKGGLRKLNEEDSEELELNKRVNYIEPESNKGNTYRDYLDIMICAMGENTRLLRMMDLVQMNIQYCYYADFNLRDYNAGLCSQIGVNGNTYEIKKEYQNA